MMMLMLVLGTTFTFSSCSDDDDDVKTSDKALVGTWCSSYTMDDEGKFDFDQDEEFTFNDDGTGELYRKKGNSKYDDEGGRWPFTWETEGDILYMKGNHAVEDYGPMKFSVSGNELRLTLDYDIPGDEEVLVYTRK
ncbi:MAG: lipocalin family protein [Bacteroidales bacterium]|nr:lipocalin family protein [Candidatus Equimonas enterica]